MLFWGMPEQPKPVVDPGIDRRRGYTIFFTIIYINDSWHIQPPICSRGSRGMPPPPPLNKMKSKA